MKLKNLFILAIALVLTEASAYATTDTSSEQVSARTKNKLGAYLAIGEPMPTIVGINVAYNITDYLRASAGYGSLSVTSGISIGSDGSVSTTQATATTIGFGVQD